MWSQDDMESPSRVLQIDSAAAVLDLLDRSPEPLLLTVQAPNGDVLLRVKLVPAPWEPGDWSPQRCRADLCRTLGGRRTWKTLAQIMVSLAAAGRDWNRAAVEAELAAMAAEGLVELIGAAVLPAYRLAAAGLRRLPWKRRPDRSGAAN
jgi:hypothetical protein